MGLLVDLGVVVGFAHRSQRGCGGLRQSRRERGGGVVGVISEEMRKEKKQDAMRKEKKKLK